MWLILDPGKEIKKDFLNPLTGSINPKTDRYGNNVSFGDPLMGANAIGDDLNTSTRPPTRLPVNLSPLRKYDQPCVQGRF